MARGPFQPVSPEAFAVLHDRTQHEQAARIRKTLEGKVSEVDRRRLNMMLEQIEAELAHPAKVDLEPRRATLNTLLELQALREAAMAGGEAELEAYVARQVERLEGEERRTMEKVFRDEIRNGGLFKE